MEMNRRSFLKAVQLQNCCFTAQERLARIRMMGRKARLRAFVAFAALAGLSLSYQIILQCLP